MWRRIVAWQDPLLVASVGLTVVGAFAMASAAATINPTLSVRHDAWILVGVVSCLGIAATNYRRWMDLAAIAYVLSVGLLVLVLLAGTVRLGATRWLSLFGLSLQPSELAKLSTVWLLARYVAGQPTPLPRRVFWTSLAMAMGPALLIFLQPDLGSASILGAIWLGVVWVAGASRLTLGRCLAGGLALLPVGWHVLKAYQRDRLLAFINPNADPLGAGYTIIQSTIAIGSGGLWGRGWFAGTQNQLSFLPERHSDFIFSVIGEEWGLGGCVLVIGLFGWLLARIGGLALRTAEPQGRYLAVGVFTWIAYQAFVNMGMVMGVLPVVGVPLPFISYGGSSMLVLWVAMGLLQSVRRLEHP